MYLKQYDGLFIDKPCHADVLIERRESLIFKK